jgi:hypothetical protein
MTVIDHAHPIDAARVAHARSRLPTADDAARVTGLPSLIADPVASGSSTPSTSSKNSASATWPSPWTSPRIPSPTRCGCCAPPD